MHSHGSEVAANGPVGKYYVITVQVPFAMIGLSFIKYSSCQVPTRRTILSNCPASRPRSHDPFPETVPDMDLES